MTFFQLIICLNFLQWFIIYISFKLKEKVAVGTDSVDSSAGPKGTTARRVKNVSNPPPSSSSSKTRAKKANDDNKKGQFWIFFFHFCFC